ncbi:L-lactate permease [Actinomadura sp. HBU206391]|uniref:L-lactate permease n=1 Tax=Actinomadura sp. HBU206391 TaxID=2731692 RepID=UPI00165029C3|nr:L-lactate permease [Actinomadura sp. HBU206391]MBC6463221.1 L-lactate permease [Actinomadura sp. HBU206391]
MFQPVLDPLADSLGLSTLCAVLPLITLFVLLGGLRVRAQWAALAALACSLLVAVLIYDMPIGQAGNAAVEGAAFGLFPIMWIVVNAIWIYNMTVVTGHFDVLRKSVCSISPDLRIQAVIIAFCFGALLEALAGFGTPVAITSVMLIALGFRPMKAAAVALVANTAPVAFGALATPIITLSKLTGMPVHDLSSVVGRQTPVLALFVPVILVFIVDGRRGVRQTWLPAMVGGVVFAVGQFIASNFMSAELTDIIASLAGTASIVLLLKFWQPRHVLTGEQADDVEVSTRIAEATAVAHEVEGGGRKGGKHSGQRSGGQESGALTSVQERPPAADVARAYAPYAVIIAIFSIAQFGPVKEFLAKATKTFAWPGLDVLTPAGTPASATTFKFDWLAAGGTLLLISGVITFLILRLSPGEAVRTYGRTVRQLAWAIFTVACVLGLAYVMNLSGQTFTIGQWIAGAGAAFAFLSPILGWLGVAVTGSDTSANALFGTLQVTAAEKAGLDPLLLAAANSSGGVLGKMISPQNLAIVAAATGLAGREGELFRRVFGWSIALLGVMCVLVFLQSTNVLSWMLP